MSPSSPGYSLFVQIVPEKKKRNINLCIIIKMWKIASNWLVHMKVEIILTSRKLQDEFLFDLTDADLLNIKYHVKSYYAKRKESGDR